jgi:hypothetical protein
LSKLPVGQRAEQWVEQWAKLPREQPGELPVEQLGTQSREQPAKQLAGQPAEQLGEQLGLLRGEWRRGVSPRVDKVKQWLKLRRFRPPLSCSLWPNFRHGRRGDPALASAAPVRQCWFLDTGFWIL